MWSVVFGLCIVCGLILILLSFFIFRRGGENEISKDIITTPTFVLGTAILIIGIIGFVIDHI